VNLPVIREHLKALEREITKLQAGDEARLKRLRSLWRSVVRKAAGQIETGEYRGEEFIS
jgi:hypothetical protein